jgi:hypothetical protein
VIRAAHPEVAEAAELQALIRPSVEPALDVAQRWVAERPDDPWSNLWLARALVGEGRSAESLPHYRRALGAPGTVDPEVLLEVAGVALGADSLALAGQILERYLRDVDPPDHQTRLRLARAYSWSGRYTAAEQQYRMVLERSPEPAVRLELARMLASAGRHDAAAAELERLMAAGRSVELVREMVRVRALAGRYGDAADELARLLEARPDDHSARLERARYLWWAGRLEDADAELTRILAAEPDHAAALSLRADVRPGIDPSVDIARTWLAEADTRANRLLLARALVKAERLEEALEHYDVVLAAPSAAADRELVVEAADVADAAGEPGRVIEILERHVAAVDRPEPAMRLRLARALAWADRPADAAVAYALYLVDVPGDLDARMERARQLAWADTASWGQARGELERVIAADPARADAIKLLGDLDRWSGDPDTALEHYRQAQALDPSVESLTDGIRPSRCRRSGRRSAPSSTPSSWPCGTPPTWPGPPELDAFTDTEGFDWIGSTLGREWHFGESALAVRLAQGWSRGRHLDGIGGAGTGSLGLGAVLAGRLAVAPGWALLGELGAMSYDDIDAFATWGGGIEFADDLSLARLRFGRTPAVREAATRAALQAGAVMDRVHLEGSRFMGPWRVATDLQLQRFRADLGDADRYAGMLVVDRKLGASGIAIGPMVRAIASPHDAPFLADWGRLYWTPDYYLAPALSIRYGGQVADGLWLGLRAAPGHRLHGRGRRWPAATRTTAPPSWRRASPSATAAAPGASRPPATGAARSPTATTRPP